jgi:aldehyde dehydrogenase (NAD+)
MATASNATDELILLARMRNFYDSGATRTIKYRKAQLQRLKQALSTYEKEISEALFADLKKGPEEVYATESGLLLAEINVALKNLDQWMRPRHAGTNLVNLPSSSKIYRDPLGVVFIIAPWNYPFQLSLIPLVGAIAGGNVALIKPSELAPATAAIIEKIIHAIYPPEYISVIQGDGAEIVPRLMHAFRFDHVFYTGSIAVGKAIAQLAATELVPLTLELGGKSPAIVEPDANLIITAKRIAVGKFTNAGQTCVAPDYVLVHNSVKEPLIAALKQTIERFFGAKPSESKSYGRIINERRFDRLISYLTEGNLITGGENDRATLFIAPTIIDHVSLDSILMKEEIFGPVLPIIGFDTMEEAMAIVRRNPNPLSLYLFTSDNRKEKAWIENIPFGGGCINNSAWQFANHHIPFGGIGYSGIGAYHGKYTFELYTHAKPMMKTPLWIDPGIKYPPFSGKLKLFKWFIR